LIVVKFILLSIVEPSRRRVRFNFSRNAGTTPHNFFRSLDLLYIQQHPTAKSLNFAANCSSKYALDIATLMHYHQTSDAK
jgi:hypothetical protein